MLKILKKIQSYNLTVDLYNDIHKKKFLNKAIVISFCNAHAVNMAQTNKEFRKDLLAADFLLRDGSGVKIAMKAMGFKPGINLNGTDFIPEFLQTMTNNTIAVYGTDEPWLSKGTEALSKEQNMITKIDGFQTPDVYIESSQSKQPDIILLAMGMPKQERIAGMLADALDYPVVIICGGAIVDFAANRFERAPELMRNYGLEWVYRLAKEPKRLFKRYLIGNFTFLIRLCCCYICNRTNT